MIIIPKNVKERTSDLLLKDAIKYCELEKATEIYNIATLGDTQYRIMYYVGEGDNRKMKAVILNIPYE
jgi:hypothetical protein